MSEPLGIPTHITLHWTAGNGTETFPDYHFCVQEGGGVAHTLPLDVKGEHTWHRNSNNVGISMCCCPPDHPPTPIQIEHTSKLVAEVCYKFGIDLHGKVRLPFLKRVGTPDGPDDALVETGDVITAPTVTDHAWFAQQDGYYPERWDIDKYLMPILGKAGWYLNALNAKTAVIEFLRP